jgi:hypothetical protein
VESANRFVSPARSPVFVDIFRVEDANQTVTPARIRVPSAAAPLVIAATAVQLVDAISMD